MTVMARARSNLLKNKIQAVAVAGCEIVVTFVRGFLSRMENDITGFCFGLIITLDMHSVESCCVNMYGSLEDVGA
jgi:hypothetical protein